MGLWVVSILMNTSGGDMSITARMRNLYPSWNAIGEYHRWNGGDQERDHETVHLCYTIFKILLKASES